jgi:hypothetical protein
MPNANVLSDELVGLIRREILKSASSFQPRPVRGRRPRRGKGGGGPGASGTFICTLSGDIAGGVTGSCGAGTGTVYSRSKGPENESLGPHKIFNPWLSVMPASAGSTILYTCAKTYEHVAPETESDDEYTLTGIDPFYLLASRPGFAAKKAYAMPEDGSTPAHQQWLGEECEAP